MRVHKEVGTLHSGAVVLFVIAFPDFMKFDRCLRHCKAADSVYRADQPTLYRKKYTLYGKMFD